jgi:hypothetical protein
VVVMVARSTAPLLANPIKCRWCEFTIRRFKLRNGTRISSAWDLLRDHIFDVHEEQAKQRFMEMPQAVAADVFEWKR